MAEFNVPFYLTTDESNRVLRHYFSNGEPLAQYTSVYVAFFQTTSIDNMRQNNGSMNEFSATNGYARTALFANSPSTPWETVTTNSSVRAEYRTITNLPTPTGGAWGTAYFMGLCASSTVGATDVLWYGTFSPAVNFGEGVTYRISNGSAPDGMRIYF